MPSPTPPAPRLAALAPASFSRAELLSAATAVVGTLILIFIAWRSYYAQSLFILAASMGALGGIGHEFAQSGGRIVFLQRRGNGLYLGSLTGAALGAIAGLLMIRGYLAPGVAVPYGQVAYESFTSGLALKGVVEALTDKPASAGGTQNNGGGNVVGEDEQTG